VRESELDVPAPLAAPAEEVDLIGCLFDDRPELAGAACRTLAQRRAEQSIETAIDPDRSSHMRHVADHDQFPGMGYEAMLAGATTASRCATSFQLTTFHTASKKSVFLFSYCK
jgi:hypothetical protein